MSWRTLLYLPLGILPALFFTLRIFVQWIQSERRKESFIGPLFWKLSLWGNILLFCHHVIQVQYPFALIQSVNALISWRNLDFLRPGPAYPRKVMLMLLVAAAVGTTLLFIMQSYFFIGEMDWIRTPQKLWNTERYYHNFFWHLFGTLGAALFASRFWVQWWMAEFRLKSEPSPTFWYLSIIGSTLLLIYSLYIGDVIVVFYNCFSLIPYIRNLMLIKH
ncbi:MAG: lipid-A-disaccharide synthase N-terminal domain-containing protein [Chlamydiales bacterium]